MVPAHIRGTLCWELNAWWIPYFFGATPERKARYGAMFGRTHTFLPERDVMFVNTFHVVLRDETGDLVDASVDCTN